MFLLRRPSPADIDRFLDRSRRLPLSYAPPGILNEPSAGRRVYEQAVVIGRGEADFQHARAALLSWKHFNLGWVEAFPDRPRIEAGTNVAVLIRHLGFWSLNGARVLHFADRTDDSLPGGGSHVPVIERKSVAFTYGTLTNHAESGEELFEVFVEPRSGDVIYKIRAVSWAQSPVARIGQPIVRLLQARFRRDSATAMQPASSWSGRP